MNVSAYFKQIKFLSFFAAGERANRKQSIKVGSSVKSVVTRSLVAQAKWCLSDQTRGARSLDAYFDVCFAFPLLPANLILFQCVCVVLCCEKVFFFVQEKFNRERKRKLFFIRRLHFLVSFANFWTLFTIGCGLLLFFRYRASYRWTCSFFG